MAVNVPPGYNPTPTLGSDPTPHRGPFIDTMDNFTARGKGELRMWIDSFYPAAKTTDGGTVPADVETRLAALEARVANQVGYRADNGTPTTVVPGSPTTLPIGVPQYNLPPGFFQSDVSDGSVRPIETGVYSIKVLVVTTGYTGTLNAWVSSAPNNATNIAPGAGTNVTPNLNGFLVLAFDARLGANQRLYVNVQVGNPGGGSVIAVAGLFTINRVGL